MLIAVILEINCYKHYNIWTQCNINQGIVKNI